MFFLTFSSLYNTVVAVCWYRINSYRVLLTRGRDGFIVFVPPGYDNIARILASAGILELV